MLHLVAGLLFILAFSLLAWMRPEKLFFLLLGPLREDEEAARWYVRTAGGAGLGFLLLFSLWVLSR